MIVLRFLSSLKLTVALFGLAVFLILVGTLAQVDYDIWEVMEDYFKPWVIWVPAKILFPATWFPNLSPTKAASGLAIAFAGIAILTTGFVQANSTSKRNAMVSSCWILGIGLTLALITNWKQQFPMFGGASIGAVMLVNLISAHMIRFKIRARGSGIVWGSLLTAAGAGLVITVIMLGHSQGGGIQGTPPFEWTTLWQVCKTALSFLSAGLFLSLFIRSDEETPTRRLIRQIAGISGLVSGLISAWLWMKGDATYLGDSGMRVLWQLIQSTAAGLVLLAGLYFLFQKRAGVVQIHLGVILMMFGQWFVSVYDVEQQISLGEGETKSYGQDIRSVELAVISQIKDHPEKEDVVAIPISVNGNETNRTLGGTIESDQLPFTIKIEDYQKNSRIERLDGTPSHENLKGDGLAWKAVEVSGVSGTAGSDVNIASMYVSVEAKGESLGTFLLSQDQLMLRNGAELKFDTAQVKLGDKTYDLQLRFQRHYKTYAVTLNDVKKEDYLGTDTPRHYASEIRIQDREKGIDHEHTVWMNNPMRFAGETFYQSGYHRDPRTNKESTTLQVVHNQGWMIPYVSCMICGVGMLYHFGLILHRFLNRTVAGQSLFRFGSYLGGDGISIANAIGVLIGSKVRDHVDSRSERKMKRKLGEPIELDRKPVGASAMFRTLLPLLIVGLAMVFVFSIARPKTQTHAGMDLSEFGRLPIVYQGRVKPMDTLARNSLKFLSEKESFKCRMSPVELEENWGDVAKDIGKEWPSLSGLKLAAMKTDDIKSPSVEDLINYVTPKVDEDRTKVEEKIEKATLQRQPAIRWLMDTISVPGLARRHKIIRITDLGVLETLNLKRRHGYRYSIDEISPNMPVFEEEVNKAQKQRQEDPRSLTHYQRKLIDLGGKLSYLIRITRAFSPTQMPPLPTKEEFATDLPKAQEKMQAFRETIAAQLEMLEAEKLPLTVAPYTAGPEEAANKNPKWQSYAAAWPLQSTLAQLGVKKLNPSFEFLNNAIVSYSSGNADEFNKSVASYHELLEREPPSELIAKRSLANTIASSMSGNFYRFETFFNRTSPFLWTAWLYVVVFILLLIGWLFRLSSFGRSSYALLCFTFLLHTLAIIARIYISGRPPVTNLYSSAIFIGWGFALFAVIGELVVPRGIFSAVASVTGFASLWIAYLLALDGDTFEVLQAVLDTQFWLATHVVTVTAGYSATFLAGGLGTFYLISGMFTKSLDAKTSNELTRMIYGTLCFAILFSFIGTVLGGLWADDSWGRFWGWDPKENGALIIVLWNALILHARWDRLVKDRGLAVLAIAGNIVTAWSWFGVNELGVGLHSYGFTEGRLKWLMYYIASQLVLVFLGCLPTNMWWSLRGNALAASASSVTASDEDLA